MRARRTPPLAPLVAVLAAFACAGGPDADGSADTDGTDDTDGAPTFTQVRDEVLRPTCSLAPCHASGEGYLLLDGTAADHTRLVGVNAFGKPSAVLVVPGDPDGSYLVQKIEGAPGIVGDPMPGGVPLGDEGVALIRAWIAAGAKND